jgi:hypothetical protein
MWAALDDLAVIVTSVPVIVAFMFSVGISATMIIVMVRLGLAPPVIIPHSMVTASHRPLRCSCGLTRSL